MTHATIIIRGHLSIEDPSHNSLLAKKDVCKVGYFYLKRLWCDEEFGKREGVSK